MDINKIPDLDMDFDYVAEHLNPKTKLMVDLETQKDLTEAYTSKFSILDNAMEGGFRDGNLVILSGYSGHGKTTLAQTLTCNYSKEGIPCLWFSYEMDMNSLMWKFRKMNIDDGFLGYAPIELSSFSIEWVKEVIKYSVKKDSTKIVFIDNLDFLSPNDVRRTDNETTIYKKVAAQLKTIAMELKVVIVLICHIVKTDEDKEPTLRDIYGSSGIYKLSDYVVFIWRIPEKKNKYKDKQEGTLYTNQSKLIIGKNRLTGKRRFTTIQLVNNIFKEVSHDEEPETYN